MEWNGKKKLQEKQSETKESKQDPDFENRVQIFQIFAFITKVLKNNEK